MKTAIQGVMDIIEMEHNNGVEIYQRVLWKMLNEAKKEEKQKIIDAYNSGWQYGFLANSSDLQPTKNSETYFSETYTTNEETLK